jgi:sulfur-carrier protein
MSFAAGAGLSGRDENMHEAAPSAGGEVAVAVLRLRGALKQVAGGQAEHALRADTVAGLLRALEREQPATRGWILDERGRIRPHINVFVNGDYGAEETPVADDDRIDVLPAISGGAL